MPCVKDENNVILSTSVPIIRNCQRGNLIIDHNEKPWLMGRTVGC